MGYFEAFLKRPFRDETGSPSLVLRKCLPVQAPQPFGDFAAFLKGFPMRTHQTAAVVSDFTMPEFVPRSQSSQLRDRRDSVRPETLPLETQLRAQYDSIFLRASSGNVNADRGKFFSFMRGLILSF